MLKFWAGKCIYRDNCRDFPTLLIPISDIFMRKILRNYLKFMASYLE